MVNDCNDCINYIVGGDLMYKLPQGCDDCPFSFLDNINDEYICSYLVCVIELYEGDEKAKGDKYMTGKIPKEFLEKLKKTRIEKGYTQTMLAELCKCKKSNISMFECGRSSSGWILYNYIKYIL